jgi:outer membrane protein assembly factor BamB
MLQTTHSWVIRSGTAMKVFISYSRQDESAVTSTVEDLERAHIDVWLDDELRGGEAWWTQILSQIRDCTVFLFAVSDKSLYSQPCRAELGYGRALGLPILPVVVGEVSSYRADPIFSTQLIDYRNPTAATGLALMGALNEHATHRTDLPDPLPEAPPIPYEYLQRVGAQIHNPAMLAPPVQAQLLFELRNALHEEDDPTVVDDICKLLRARRRRTDVTYPVATEIDSMLGDVAPDSGQPRDSEVRRAAKAPATDARPSGQEVPLLQRLNPRTKILAPPIEPAAPPTEQPSPAGTRRLSRRMILMALGGTAVLVAGGTAIKLIPSGRRTESSAKSLSGKPGAVLWAEPAGSTIILSSPTLGDGSVFVAGYDKHVYALDEASGAERWTAATGDRVRPSPAFADGRVYVASWDGNVYALDASTGEVRWKTPVGDSFPVSPVVADQTVYFGTTDGYVQALDAASGKVRWNTLTNGAASAAPTVADGVLYIGTEGHVYALDAPTGTVRWSKDIGGQAWSSPAVADGRVFLGNDDHSVYALRAETGEVSWTTPTDGAVYSSPAAGGGLIYFGSDDKNVYALDAGSGEVRWKTPTGGRVHSSPAVADGAVYVGSFDGFLYALGATDGAVRWKAGTGGQVWSSPTVAEKVVYVGSYDGKIYAVER